MSESEAPGLHAALDELCQKARMAKPILTFPITEKIQKPLVRHLMDNIAAAVWIDRPRILIGDNMRRFFEHENLHAPISEEFKAVLAHELSHIKHGDVKLWKIIPQRQSPFIGIAVGLAAVGFYEELKRREAKEKKDGARQEAINRGDIEAVWQDSDKISNDTPNIFQPMLTAAKYIAGGLLGFGVGAAFYSVAHKHMEFRADRFSAELMEDGKPLARALKQIREGFIVAQRDNPEFVQEYRKQNFIKKFLDSLTHPSDQERIARLEAWSR